MSLRFSAPVSRLVLCSAVGLVLLANTSAGVEVTGTKLDFPDSSRAIRFGYSAAIDGDIAVVGAPGYLTTDQGSAFVFRRTGGVWAFEQELTSPDVVGEAEFGRSVDTEPSGRFIVVGAPHDDAATTRGGAAFVFEYDTETSTWVQHTKLTHIEETRAYDLFGTAVAIDSAYPQDVPGNDLWYTVIVGAPGDDYGSPTSYQCGSVHIFEGAAGGVVSLAPHMWLLSTNPPELPPDSSEFGNSVDISGDMAVVGRKGLSPDFDYAVYKLRRTGVINTWGIENVFENFEAGDNFGFEAVAIERTSVTRIVVGSDLSDRLAVIDAGAAFFYEGSANSFTEQEIVRDHADPKHFGNDVGVSGDLIVVGAEGSQDDKTYVFHIDGGTVSLRTELVPPDTTAGSRAFGRAVAISGGTVLVTDLSGTQPTGTAYIYEGLDWLFADDFESSDTSQWSATVP